MFVACDESGKNSSDKHFVIGSAWITKQGLSDFEKKVTELRLKHKCWGEIKWEKTKNMSDEMHKFYIEFINLAFDEIEICFKFIIIKKSILKMKLFHKGSDELMQYKFTQLLISRYAKRFLDEDGKKGLHIVYDKFAESKKSVEEKWALEMIIGIKET